MTLSSLPDFPTGKQRRIANDEAFHSARQFQLIKDVVILVVILAMVYSLRQIAIVASVVAPPQQSLGFGVIEQRFKEANSWRAVNDVWESLGPCTERVNCGGEFLILEQSIEKSFRLSDIPGGGLWWKWVDCHDKNKWVAVLIEDGRVYTHINTGFERSRIEPNKRGVNPRSRNPS